jgi:hypothetical protein
MDALGAPALLALLAGVQLGAEAGVQVGSRARFVSVEEADARSAGELELVPRLALFGEGRLRLEAAYAPRIFVPFDVDAGAPELRSRATLQDNTELLHRAEFAVQRSMHRTLSIELRAEGAYGRTDLRDDHLTAAEPVPTTSRIDYQAARVSTGVEWAASRRSVLASQVAGFTAGGADAAAREQLPLQEGVELASSLRWSATRRDILIGRVVGSFAWFTPRAEAGHLTLSTIWQRSLRRTLAARVGGGVVAAHSSQPGSDAGRELSPWAELALSHTPSGPRVSAELVLLLEPSINAIERRVDQRFGARASAAWEPTRVWRFHAEGSASGAGPADSRFSAGPGEIELRLGTVEVRAVRRVGERTAVSVGTWARFQRSSLAGVPSFDEWGGLLVLSVRARWPEWTRPAPAPANPQGEMSEAQENASMAPRPPPADASTALAR